MGLIDRHREPSATELRMFGLVVIALGGVLGWIAWRRFEAHTAAGAIWGVSAALVALYYALPPIRRSMYDAWMTVFYPLGWLISHGLLAIVYFLVLTPIGLLARLFGHDPMERSFDRQAESYWKPRPVDDDPKRYFKQF